MENNGLFSSRYYKINRLFMRQIGIWPEQSRATRTILPTAIVLTVASILFPEILRMYDTWGNIDNVIEGIPAMVIIGVSWMKLINGAVKRSAVITLIERMQEDWKSMSNCPASVAILQKFAEAGRTLTVTYAALVYTVLLTFLGLPIIPLALNVIAPLNESRPRIYLFPTEYRVDAEKYYYLMLFHSYVTSYACIVIYVVVDTTLSLWIQHCCALFEIVSCNLKCIIGGSSNAYRDQRTQYEKLCLCIKQHKRAIIFASLIESTYSSSLFVTVCFNMFIMSVTGVLVVIKMGDLTEVLRFGALTVSLVYHLYFTTVSGQQLIDHSERIGVSAYDGHWYAYTWRAQKLVLLIMARAQKPISLTAGKIYVINMENFSSVMQTSISYFTVLCSLR